MSAAVDAHLGTTSEAAPTGEYHRPYRNPRSTTIRISVDLLVVDTVPYGYWLMRRRYEPVSDGEISDDNKAWLRYTGYSAPPLRQRLIWAVVFGLLAVVLMNVFSSSL